MVGSDDVICRRTSIPEKEFGISKSEVTLDLALKNRIKRKNLIEKC